MILAGKSIEELRHISNSDQQMDFELYNSLLICYKHLLKYACVNMSRWQKTRKRLNMQHIDSDYASIVEGFDILNAIVTINSLVEVEKTKTETAHTKREWSSTEDEALVTMAGLNDEDFTISNIARLLNRTPASVSTRLSQLVGVNRKSKPVNGRFEGMMEGQEIEAHVTGRVWKE